MSGTGRYSATRDTNTSTLWNYGEVPVASAKLNTWNGNVAAAFDLLHQAMAALSGADAADCVISESSGEELLAVAADTPDLSVRVRSGRAWIGGFISHLAAEGRVPGSGSFTAPATHPRIDLVHLDAYGDLAFTAGVEAASPAVPDAPDGALVLARVHHRPGESSIQDTDDSVNGYLEDVRAVVVVGRAHAHPAGGDRFPGESADGARVQFSTPGSFRAGTLAAWLNGVRQTPGVDYDEDAGRESYTFTTAPLTGDAILHDYEKEGA